MELLVVYMIYYYRKEKIYRMIYSDLTLEEAKVVLYELQKQYPDKSFIIDKVFDYFQNNTISLN